MDKFETWWESEGQEFLFALNTTTDDDIKLVAEIAWKNGAYCAEQAEQEPVGVVSPNSVINWRVGQDPLPPRTKLYAAPVLTKDLTGQDLCDLEIAVGWKGDSYDFEVIVKTVIAKFKEKNRG